MKPYVANFIYGFLLILFSLTGYVSSANPSPTALIPVFFGLLFLALTLKMKAENKTVAHIVVILTFILIIALVKPLTGAIGRNDSMAVIRVGIMIGWGIIAAFVYIKSFINARRNRSTDQS